MIRTAPFKESNKDPTTTPMAHRQPKTSLSRNLMQYFRLTIIVRRRVLSVSAQIWPCHPFAPNFLLHKSSLRLSHHRTAMVLLRNRTIPARPTSVAHQCRWIRKCPSKPNLQMAKAWENSSSDEISRLWCELYTILLRYIPREFRRFLFIKYPYWFFLGRSVLRISLGQSPGVPHKSRIYSVKSFCNPFLS